MINLLGVPQFPAFYVPQTRELHVVILVKRAPANIPVVVRLHSVTFFRRGRQARPLEIPVFLRHARRSRH